MSHLSRNYIDMDTHVPRLHRVLLRLWNDTAWLRTEREREERQMLEYARWLLEWDGGWREQLATRGRAVTVR